MYIIFFTENVLPKLSEEQRSAYKVLVTGGDQMLAIGNIVNDRQLVRLVTLAENILPMLAMLNALHKDVIICGCYTVEKEIITKIDDTIIDFNKTEYLKHFEPIDGVAPLENIVAGWADFLDVANRKG